MNDLNWVAVQAYLTATDARALQILWDENSAKFTVRAAGNLCLGDGCSVREAFADAVVAMEDANARELAYLEGRLEELYATTQGAQDERRRRQ